MSPIGAFDCGRNELFLAGSLFGADRPTTSLTGSRRGSAMLRYAIEITGWLAAAMMLSAYLLLTMGKLSARAKVYQWFNVLSGAGFMINSGWNGAYPSAFINVVWMCIGLYGLFGGGLPGRASPGA